MASIILRQADDLRPRVERILSLLLPRLRTLVPSAEAHHIGATAIPGALTKGDVDVVLRVPSGHFQMAIDTLKQHYLVKQPDNWTPDFASFGDDMGYELPIGIQLVIYDSSSDFFLFLHDYFTSRPEAVDEYNRLKKAHAGNGREDYWKAKDEFFAPILAARIKK